MSVFISHLVFQNDFDSLAWSKIDEAVPTAVQLQSIQINHELEQLLVNFEDRQIAIGYLSLQYVQQNGLKVLLTWVQLNKGPKWGSLKKFVGVKDVDLVTFLSNLDNF